MRTAKTLKIIGLLPVGLMILVFLIFGFGESLGGDWSGLMHIVQFVILGLAIWLSWKRPLWGGVLLLAAALFRTLALVPKLFPHPSATVWNSSLISLILIPAISGGLFLAAGVLERKTATGNMP